MRSRPLGQSGIEASVVGLGSWAIGGTWWGGTDEAAAVDAIRRALDLGITLVDTAPGYGWGLSEELVGKAIAGRRDQVVLATKCGLVWDTDQGQFHFAMGDKKVYRYLGAESVRREVEESLRRLGTDRLDLLQTHWQDPTTPIEETMGAMMALKAEGKIRAIGVSNATVAQIEEYRKVGPVDVDQERFSMLDRGMEAEQLPYCRAHGIAVLAYSPMALGLLTGKIGPERTFPADDLRSQLPRFSPENRQKAANLLAAIRPIADAHGISLAQLAVAWAIAQPGLTHALVGARNPVQAAENAGAGDVVLSADEVARINQAIEEHAQGV